jgi:hypothetical protein
VNQPSQPHPLFKGCIAAALERRHEKTVWDVVS